MREVLEAIVAADGRSLDPEPESEPEPGPGPDEAEAENAEAEAEGGASASGTAMDADAEPAPETGTASETAVGAETDAPHGTEATADAPGQRSGSRRLPPRSSMPGAWTPSRPPAGKAQPTSQRSRPRSEERRVGKECRSRWATAQQKENKTRQPTRPRADARPIQLETYH